MENTNTNPVIIGKTNGFEINEVINHGWELFKKNWKTLVLIILVGMLVSYFFQGLIFGLEYLYSAVDEQGVKAYGVGMPWLMWALIIIITLVSYCTSLVLAYNSQKIYLKVVDGQEIKVKNLFEIPTANIFYWIAAGICYVLVVIAGCILLIIPGIYLAIRYSYVTVLVLDKGLSVGDAFRMSTKMTDGIKWNLIGLGFVWIGIGILSFIAGLICLIVGVIPAMISFSITMQISMFYLYRKLSANTM